MLYRDMLREYKEETGIGIDKNRDVVIRALSELNRGILYNLYDNVSIELNNRKDVTRVLVILRDEVDIFDDIKITLHQKRFLWFKRNKYVINIKVLPIGNMTDIINSVENSIADKEMDTEEMDTKETDIEEIDIIDLLGKTMSCRVIDLDNYKKGDK